MVRNNDSPREKFKYARTLVIMSMFLAVFGGCNFPKPRFGLEANDKRKKIGLATLPENWEASSIGKDYTVWHNPMAGKILDDNNPVFFSKAVKYDQKNNLISEEDLYYSGERIITLDGSQRESLSVKYYFQPQKVADIEISGWYNTYYGNELGSLVIGDNSELGSLFPVQLDVTTADSILIKWGLEPPKREIK